MFKCWECGHEFLEPNIWTEHHGETLCGCPSCSGAFEIAHECEICGGWFIPAESKLRDVCQECIDELVEKHEQVLTDNFTEFELEILEAVF